MTDGNRDGSNPGDDPSPADVFALVGNEIRAEILRAFGDARVERGSPPVLSFSEVRERADVDAVSSQFNYHLQQLVGHYLERVDDGYRMRPEGRVLYQRIRAGTFEGDDAERTLDAGFDCHFCGTPVEATVGAGLVAVECPDCEYRYAFAGAPPGASDDRVALSQVAKFYHHRHLAFARGVCVTCGTEPGIELLSAEDSPVADPARDELHVYRACPNCGDQRHLTLGTALLPDPGLRRFCYDHDVDALSTPLWELDFAATDRSVTVHSTDPWEVSLDLARGDETLELVVDGDLDVIDRRRA